MEDPIKVPAIGFSTTANIDGNRQIVFQGFFDESETDKVVNDRLDRIMRLVDRQRAKYEMPALKEERQKLEDEMAQYVEDEAKAEQDFQKAQATFDVQILEANRVITDETEAGYNEHVRIGKGGAYKPSGNRKRSIDLAQSAIDNYKEQKLKHVNEKQQWLDNLKISMERRQARVALLNEKIQDLEKVFGG